MEYMPYSKKNVLSTACNKQMHQQGISYNWS